MPRLNTNAEILHRLTEVGIHDDRSGGGSTTLSSGASAGASSISCASSTNFANGDKLRISRNEYNEITTISGAGPFTFNLKRPLEFAHVTGEAVVETIDVPVGDISVDGVTFDSQTEETVLKVGTQRGVYLYIPSGTEQKFTFNMVCFSLENVAEAFGINPTTITGAGSAGSPYILTLNTAIYGTQPERLWYFLGIREDGQFVRGDFWRSKVYSPQTQLKIVTGEPTVIPINLRTVGLIKFFLNTP